MVTKAKRNSKGENRIRREGGNKERDRDRVREG